MSLIAALINRVPGLTLREEVSLLLHHELIPELVEGRIVTLLGTAHFKHVLFLGCYALLPGLLNVIPYWQEAVVKISTRSHLVDSQIIIVVHIEVAQPLLNLRDQGA